MGVQNKRLFQEQIFDRDGRRRPGNVYSFEWVTRRNDVASQKAGRPVYDQALMVEIRSAGATKSVPVEEIEIRYTDGNGAQQVRPRMAHIFENGRELTMRERYKQYLDAWEGNLEAPNGGTPLEAWPRTADVALIASLRESGIYTVEMLADLPDSRLDVLPLGGRDLREQAKVFIAAAAGNAQYEGIIAQNVDMKAQIELLQKQIAEIHAADARRGDSGGEGTEPRRGPGRPPKQNVA